MAVPLVAAATPIYMAGSLTGSITVPVGVTTAHMGIITFTSGVSGTDDFGVSGGAWTQLVEDPTGQSNSEVAHFKRLGGHTAGETITVSQTLSHNTRVSAVWLDTGGRDIVLVGTVGVRNAISQAVTVIPGLTLTSTTQDVLVFATERTTADGTTLTGWSGGETPTQLYFIEFPSDIDSSHYYGTFVPSSTTVPTLTATYSASSGNATGVMVALAPVVASDTTAPSVPSGVTAVANGATQVTVSWTASTDAVGVSSYRVRRGGVDVTGATAVAGTSFVDTTVSPSTSYSYTVSAVDAAGNRSAESTAAPATTPAAGSPAVATAGPLQSEPSTTAMSLGWVLDTGTSIRAVASLSSSFTSPVYGVSMTRPSHGWVTSRITGLTANTKYYVGVEVDGTLIATGRGSYTTLKSGLVASKVISSSCSTTGSAHAVFSRILAEAPDIFVHQGDIAYPTFNTVISEATWKANFVSSITSSTQRPLFSAIPWDYSPDNHDGPNSNTGAGSEAWSAQVSTNVRELAGEVFGATTKGLYRTWVNAGVRYVMMDCWSFRNASSDTNSSSKTMLGITQRTWLLNIFATATEPAIIVFSHFPHYSNLIGGGRWGDFPDERVIIGNAITALPATQRNKIIFCGGDSHSINADNGANAMWGRPSLNASPLNQTGGLASGTWNIANIDVPDADGVFSRFTFTPSGSTLAMTWDAVDQDGDVLATWSTTFPVTATQNIRYGTQTVSDIRYGTLPVDRVYQGTTQIWP